MNPSSSDDTLAEAITDYFTTVGKGESPDQQELLRRYPGCAEELQEFFEEGGVLDDFLEKAGLVDAQLPREQKTSAVDNSHTRVDGEASDSCLPQVDGYLVQAEIGAGSQGVVYKAQQAGTNRTVAL